MERECPFWAQHRLCNTGKCTVCECTDDEVPNFWRIQKSKAGFGHQLGLTSTLNQAPAKREPECPESLNEWCIDDVVDEDAEYEGSIFVDLVQNRESYTGYAGEPVWRTIYAENCDCLDGIDAQQDMSDQECSEHTLLYQLMSGLHTSINTHIADGFENAEGNPVHNLTYFRSQVGSFDERIKNLHLLFAVVVRAVSAVEPALLTPSHLRQLELQETKDLEKRLI